MVEKQTPKIDTRVLEVMALLISQRRLSNNMNPEQITFVKALIRTSYINGVSDGFAAQRGKELHNEVESLKRGE
jgi:hypothetical protein